MLKLDLLLNRKYTFVLDSPANLFFEQRREPLDFVQHFYSSSKVEKIKVLGFARGRDKFASSLEQYTSEFGNRLKFHRQGQALQLQNRVCSCTPCGCNELIYPEEGNSYTIKLVLRWKSTK